MFGVLAQGVSNTLLMNRLLVGVLRRSGSGDYAHGVPSGSSYRRHSQCQWAPVGILVICGRARFSCSLRTRDHRKLTEGMC